MAEFDKTVAGIGSRIRKFVEAENAVHPGKSFKLEYEHHDDHIVYSWTIHIRATRRTKVKA